MYDLPAGRAACQHLIDPLIGFQSVLFAASGTADKGILSGFDLRGNFSFFFPASAKEKEDRQERVKIFHCITSLRNGDQKIHCVSHHRFGRDNRENTSHLRKPSR